MNLSPNTLIKLVGLTLLVLLLGYGLGLLPARAGKVDFRAYWSASYLLAHGGNFADDDQLMTVQRELTDFDVDYAMKTWNPPWVLVWLLPYSWVEFDTAVNFWLLTNICVLFFSVVMSWHLNFPASGPGIRSLWMPFLAALLFPSTIVALMFGQVNLLVLGGLVGFLVFFARNQELWAGLALALTTFKPHLVYLTLPIILLHLVWRRQWLTLVTFFSFLALSMGVILLLRPTFWDDYFQSTITGNLFAWETATLTTFLSLKTGWHWVRLLGLGLLPLVLVGWFYNKQRLPIIVLVEITVLLSVITMPFGWSYDFVVLLLPLMRVLAWLKEATLSGVERFGVLGTLVVTYLVYHYQRMGGPSELYFFWVPLVIALLYGWMAWRSKLLTSRIPL